MTVCVCVCVSNQCYCFFLNLSTDLRDIDEAQSDLTGVCVCVSLVFKPPDSSVRADETTLCLQTRTSHTDTSTHPQTYTGVILIQEL